MIGAVHVPPAYTVPLAAGVAALGISYVLRLGRPDVPPSRRWIRRVSMGVILAGLPPCVAALSYADSQESPTAYVASWLLVLLAALLLLVTAAVDVLNTLRLEREQRRRDVIDAAVSIAKAGGAGSQPGSGG